VGLYAYRRDFLLSYAALTPTPLEEQEKLEQLRALEHGHRIRVVVTEHESFGVDIPDDLGKILQRIEEERPDMAEKKSTKYIFVTGGVVSSLGKGLAASSMGALLEVRGSR